MFTYKYSYQFVLSKKKKNYPFSQKEKKENSKKQKESKETQIRPTQTFSLPILQPNKLQDSSLN